MPMSDSAERLNNSVLKTYTKPTSPIKFAANIKSVDSMEILGTKGKDLKTFEGNAPQNVKNLTANNSS